MYNRSIIYDDQNQSIDILILEILLDDTFVLLSYIIQSIYEREYDRLCVTKYV